MVTGDPIEAYQIATNHIAEGDYAAAVPLLDHAAVAMAGDEDFDRLRADVRKRATFDMDRYLRIEAWAKARYRDSEGKLTMWCGRAVAGWPDMPDNGDWRVPSRYSMIEDMAAAKYLGLARKFPHWNLATAYNPNRSAA